MGGTHDNAGTVPASAGQCRCGVFRVCPTCSGRRVPGGGGPRHGRQGFCPWAGPPPEVPRPGQLIQAWQALCRGRVGRRIFASAGHWPSRESCPAQVPYPAVRPVPPPKQAGPRGLVAALGRVPGLAAPQVVARRQDRGLRRAVPEGAHPGAPRVPHVPAHPGGDS
jgi:hypothetical protein